MRDIHSIKAEEIFQTVNREIRAYVRIPFDLVASTCIRACLTTDLLPFDLPSVKVLDGEVGRL